MVLEDAKLKKSRNIKVAIVQNENVLYVGSLNSSGYHKAILRATNKGSPYMEFSLEIDLRDAYPIRLNRKQILPGMHGYVHDFPLDELTYPESQGLAKLLESVGRKRK